MDVYWVIPILAWLLGVIMGLVSMSLACMAAKADRMARHWTDHGA